MICYKVAGSSRITLECPSALIENVSSIMDVGLQCVFSQKLFLTCTSVHRIWWCNNIKTSTRRFKPLKSFFKPLKSLYELFGITCMIITSGAIQGYVPTKDILVVLARNLDVPKSQIYQTNHLLTNLMK